jgi:hypothetical protein
MIRLGVMGGVVLLFGMVVHPSLGAILNPVATSGHDSDIIFENDASPAQNEEIGSRWFFEEGLLTVGTPPPLGLPVAPTRTASATLTSTNTVNFAFNDYNANNVLMFETGNPAATLTLDAPAGYTQLAVVTSAGSLGSDVALLPYTIHYEGGGTQTGTINVADWGNATLPSGTERLLVADRANTGPVLDGSRRSATRWAVFVSEITPNSTANILSVDFGPPSLNTVGTPLASGDDVAVFGLAGTPIPEPGSLALAALGALGLLRRRRA